MALTHALVKQEAAAAQLVASELASLLTRLDQFLEHNSDLAIDWAAVSTPAYITEDAAGNLQDLLFSRQAVANVIGSFAQVRTLLTGGTPSTGDHLGNLNQLAQPLG